MFKYTQIMILCGNYKENLDEKYGLVNEIINKIEENFCFVTVYYILDLIKHSLIIIF